MCRQVQCKKCQKPSWAGCGAHVEQVLGHIPVADRCHCADDAIRSGETGGGIRGRILKMLAGKSN